MSSDPSPGGRPPLARLLLAFVAVYVIWGSTYLAIALAIETIPPFAMAGLRFCLAGGLVYGWARLRGAARPRAAHWRSAAVIGGLMLFLANGGVVWAETRVASGVAALLVASVPFWMVLLDWLRRDGERPGGRVIIGLAVGLAGLYLLTSGDGRSEERVDLLGAAVLLAASLFWSIGSLYSRTAQQADSKWLATGMQMLAGGLMHATASGLTGEWGRLDPSAVSLRSAAALLYLVAFGSIVGFTAFMWLMQVTTPARAGTYAYVNPVVAVFLGWALHDEPLTRQMVLAAAVIVTAVVLITTARAAAPVGLRAAGGEAGSKAPPSLDRPRAADILAPPPQPVGGIASCSEARRNV